MQTAWALLLLIVLSVASRLLLHQLASSRNVKVGEQRRSVDAVDNEDDDDYYGSSRRALEQWDALKYLEGAWKSANGTWTSSRRESGQACWGHEDCGDLLSLDESLSLIEDGILKDH